MTLLLAWLLIYTGGMSWYWYLIALAVWVVHVYWYVKISPDVVPGPASEPDSDDEQPLEPSGPKVL